MGLKSSTFPGAFALCVAGLALVSGLGWTPRALPTVPKCPAMLIPDGD